MSSARVHIDGGGSIALLTITNSPVNALDRQTLDELSSGIDTVASDVQARAVVIAGDGRGFSAGADIREFAGERRQRSELVSRLRFECELNDRIEMLQKPTVAAMHGFALGGGLELALSCDFRIAAASTTFGFPEIELGVFPASGALLRLPKIVGERCARRLLLLGERIPAAEALTIGLIDEVVSDAEVRQRAFALADRVGKHSPYAVAAVKELLQAQRDSDASHLVRLMTARAADIAQTTEAAERLRAYE